MVEQLAVETLGVSATPTGVFPLDQRFDYLEWTSDQDYDYVQTGLELVHCCLPWRVTLTTTSVTRINNTHEGHVHGRTEHLGS